MPIAAFLHDTDLETLGGAELSCKKIIQQSEQSGFQVIVDPLRDFENTKDIINASDVVILNSLFRCDFEFDLIEHLLQSKKPCIRWEHDYGFCSRRTALCFVDKNVRNCCTKQRVDLYRRLFQHANLNIFQSPLHYKIHYSMFGEIIHPRILLPPPIDMSEIKIQKKRRKSVAFVGLLNPKKGSDGLYRYALSHSDKHITIIGEDRSKKQWPDNVVLKGKLKQEDVFEILSTSESFFFKPIWPEPSGRAVVEAYLAQCRLFINDRVGSATYAYFPSKYESVKKAVSNSACYFWNAVEKNINTKIKNKEDAKRIQIIKSSGGLGDFFLAFPAIKKVHDRYTHVQTYVPDVLMDTFCTSFPDMRFSPFSQFEGQDKKYTETKKIVDCYNYPFENGKDEGGVIQLKYSTHQRVRQHVTEHYIHAISRIFPKIDLESTEYPYLNLGLDINQYKIKDTIVIHPGAGYIKKCWPAENYIALIEKILSLFPGIKIHIFVDEDCSHIAKLIDKQFFERIEISKNKSILEIARCLLESLCYVGNDSGISHLAGALNVPSVVIHGPTGPGTWSSCSSNKMVVYGKKTCHRECNYEVAKHCKERICLTSITPEELLAAILKMMGQNFLNKSEKIGKLFLMKNPIFHFSSQDGEVIIWNSVNARELKITGNLHEVREFMNNLDQGIRYSEIKKQNQDIQDLTQLLLDESVLLLLPAL